MPRTPKMPQASSGVRPPYSRRPNPNVTREYAMQQERYMLEAQREFTVLGEADYAKAGFVELDLSHGHACHAFFVGDSFAQAVRAVLVNGVLGGGIDFSYGSGGGMMQGKPLPGATNDELEQYWTEVLRKALDCLYCYGLVCYTSVPHPVYGLLPSVMPMERLRIRMRASLDGKHEYLVFPLQDGSEAGLGGGFGDVMGLGAMGGNRGGGGPDGVAEETDLETMLGLHRTIFGRPNPSAPLYGVRVVAMNEPAPDGTLRSKVASVWEDAVELRRLRALNLAAAAQAAVPPLVVATPPDQLTENVRLDVPDAMDLRGAGRLHERTQVLRTAAQNVQQARLINTSLGGHAGEGSVALSSLRTAALEQMIGDTSNGRARRIMLGEGQQLASAPQAISPQLLPEQLAGLEERIGNALGAPRGMFASAGSRNSAGNSVNGYNAAVLVTYNASLGAMRRYLDVLATNMFASTVQQSLDAVVASSDQATREMMAGSRVVVRIRGSVPPDHADAMFASGILTPQGAADLYARAYSLPAAMFSKDPIVHQVRSQMALEEQKAEAQQKLEKTKAKLAPKPAPGGASSSGKK